MGKPDDVSADRGPKTGGKRYSVKCLLCGPGDQEYFTVTFAQDPALLTPESFLKHVLAARNAFVHESEVMTLEDFDLRGFHGVHYSRPRVIPANASLLHLRPSHLRRIVIDVKLEWKEAAMAKA